MISLYHIAHNISRSHQHAVRAVGPRRRRASSKALSRASVMVLLAATALSASAQTIATELQAMKAVKETTANGVEKETLVPVKTILPGERVRYTLNFRNRGDQPVTGVVVTLPVPADMTFVAGSANQTGTEVTYSVDGGTTFDRLERLTITTVDGLVRPARATDVTAIRWAIAQTVAPAQTGAVSCLATVN